MVVPTKVPTVLAANVNAVGSEPIFYITCTWTPMR